MRNEADCIVADGFDCFVADGFLLHYFLLGQGGDVYVCMSASI